MQNGTSSCLGRHLATMPPGAPWCGASCHGVPRRRRGFTLLEMLITLVIMLLITAAAIPVMRPALQGRQQREAARGVTTFLQGARTRAMELGRPVGVWIERDPNQPQMASTLFQCEVPEPWTGTASTTRLIAATVSDGTNSFLTVTPIIPGPGFVANPAVNYSIDTGWASLVSPGDRIRVGTHGAELVVFAMVDERDNTTGALDGQPTDFNTDGTPDSFIVVPVDPIGETLPAIPATGLTFQVLRQPIKNPASPLELPTGFVIDLLASGTPASPRLAFAGGGALIQPEQRSAFDTFYPLQDGVNGTSGVRYLDTGGVTPLLPLGVEAAPVVLLFSPSGALDRVYSYQAFLGNASAGTPPDAAFGFGSRTVTSLVYLLLSRRDQVPLRSALVNTSWARTLRRPGTQDWNISWKDVGNLWLTVSPTSGRVAVNPVSPPEPGLEAQINPTTRPLEWIYAGLNNSRKLAQEAVTLGGR